MALPWQPASPTLPWEPAAGCGALPRGALPRGETSLRDHRRGFGGLLAGSGLWVLWGAPEPCRLRVRPPRSPRDFGFRSFGAEPQLSGRTAGTPVLPVCPQRHRELGCAEGVAIAQVLQCGLGVPWHSPRVRLKDVNNKRWVFERRSWAAGPRSPQRPNMWLPL